MIRYNQKFGVNEFLSAVNSLFYSKNDEVKKNANKYLFEFEKSPESWDIAYQILLKNNLSGIVYYNVLQILKNKLKYDFGIFIENPIYIEKLLSFLELNIDRFSHSEYYIIINYCDCISKALLFTGDKFKIFLKKFIMKLTGENNDIYKDLNLLLIFNFICDTSNDDNIVIDIESREEFIKNVKNISEDVFHFISYIINKLHSIEEKNLINFFVGQILDSIIYYIKYEFDKNGLDKFNNEFLPIIEFIFQINEEKIEKYSECICYLLKFPLHKNKMSLLSKYVFSKIYQLKDIFYKSVKNLDENQTSFYKDVFTALIQNNINYILKEKRLDLFQIVVELTKKCPHTKIFRILEFFEFFNEYLNNLNYTAEDIMFTFENIFVEFIRNLTFLTKFDDNIFEKLNILDEEILENNEEYEEYIITSDFRNVIYDILDNFTKNYRYYFIFDKIIYPEINIIIEKIKESKNNIKLLCKLENLLYFFSCIGKDINLENKLNNKIIILFHTIFDVPKEFIQITRTINEIINSCSKIFFHEKELLLKAFKYLMNGLSNPLTLKSCSNSCKSLLIDNKKIMSEFKNDLLILYNNKLKKSILLNKNYLYIIEGLVEVLVYSNNDENDYDIIKKNIIEILKPLILYLNEIKNIIEENEILSHEDSKKLEELLNILKYLSISIFNSINQNNINIMEEMLSEIWPYIIFILKKMSSNNNVVENIINFIKIFIDELNHNFFKYIPEYTEIIINEYKVNPISTYLYAFEVLVTSFPDIKDNNIRIILNNNFNKLCQITFNSFKNESDLNNLINLSEEFFGMLYRITKLSPGILLESEMMEYIINFSLNYMITSQIQISKNIISFFDSLIYFQKLNCIKDLEKENKILYEKYKNIVNLRINNFSFILCEKILKIFVDVPSKQVLEEIVYLLKHFIKYYKELALKVFNLNLNKFPNDILSIKEKNEFINLIDNYSTKKGEFNKFINNLVNKCINKSIRDSKNKDIK